MRTHDTLCLSVYGELFAIDLDNTMYFEADDHYTHVYYLSGTHFMIPFGLARVEREIAALPHPDGGARRFARLGRRHIVNLGCVFHVNAVRQTATLTDNHGVNHTLHLPKTVLRHLMDMLDGGSGHEPPQP